MRLNKRHIFSQSLLTLTNGQASQLNQLPTGAREQTTAFYQKLIEDSEIDSLPDDLEETIQHTADDMLHKAAAVGWVRSQLGPMDIRNTDGESIVMSANHLSIKGDPQAIIEKLNGHFEWVERDKRWHWLNDSNKVVAMIDLTEKKLIVDTNSVERSERANTELSTLLGDLVGVPVGMRVSPEDRLSESHPTLSAGSNDKELLTSPQAQAAVSEYLTNHYRQTLDEPIPMLGDKSPRECASNEKYRHKAIGWLQEIDRQNDKNQPYDTTWMWEELNLTQHRTLPS